MLSFGTEVFSSIFNHNVAVGSPLKICHLGYWLSLLIWLNHKCKCWVSLVTRRGPPKKVRDYVLEMKTRSSLCFSAKTILQAAACSQHATHVTVVFDPSISKCYLSSSTSCASYLLALCRELNLNHLSGGFNAVSVTYLHMKWAYVSVKSLIAEKTTTKKKLTNGEKWYWKGVCDRVKRSFATASTPRAAC